MNDSHFRQVWWRPNQNQSFLKILQTLWGHLSESDRLPQRCIHWDHNPVHKSKSTKERLRVKIIMQTKKLCTVGWKKEWLEDNHAEDTQEVIFIISIYTFFCVNNGKSCFSKTMLFKYITFASVHHTIFLKHVKKKKSQQFPSDVIKK